MFITPDELKTVMYTYQVSEITENDTDIAQMAIDAAVGEMKGYLRRYDTSAIFTATGTDRNPLIMELCKSMAAWYLIRLANVDMLYSQIKERYDRAVAWLTKVADGGLFPELPLITAESGQVQTTMRTGSQPKFNHHY
jgi:phage gp36-like protein